MKTETRHREVDMVLYQQNQMNFPPEKLDPYQNQFVAFNWDGTEIIASAASDPELVAKLDEMGIPSTSYVIGWAGPA